ncbi:MAG: hypothetical protein V3W31_05635 [Thermodesulfobacteriota bacterium]
MGESLSAEKSLSAEESLSAYEDTLEKLAETESTEFVNNSSKEHASIMIKRLFLEAKGQVRILSDHLNPDVYGRPGVIDAAMSFLGKSAESRLEVIVQLNEEGCPKPEDNAFVGHLLEEHEGKITLYQADEKLKECKNHFMVVTTDKGKHALRYELDTKAHLAIGTFNAGVKGQRLIDSFGDMLKIKGCTPLPLTASKINTD